MPTETRTKSLLDKVLGRRGGAQAVQAPPPKVESAPEPKKYEITNYSEIKTKLRDFFRGDSSDLIKHWKDGFFEESNGFFSETAISELFALYLEKINQFEKKDFVVVNVGWNEGLRGSPAEVAKKKADAWNFLALFAVEIDGDQKEKPLFDVDNNVIKLNKVIDNKDKMLALRDKLLKIFEKIIVETKQREAKEKTTTEIREKQAREAQKEKAVDAYLQPYRIEKLSLDQLGQLVSDLQTLEQNPQSLMDYLKLTTDVGIKELLAAAIIQVKAKIIEVGQKRAKAERAETRRVNRDNKTKDEAGRQWLEAQITTYEPQSQADKTRARLVGLEQWGLNRALDVLMHHESYDPQWRRDAFANVKSKLTNLRERYGNNIFSELAIKLKAELNQGYINLNKNEQEILILKAMGIGGLLQNSKLGSVAKNDAIINMLVEIAE